jgi:hypothetical protein
MSYLLDAPRCEHLHDSGIRCGSPALRGKQFCYNHQLLYEPRILPGQEGYRLPPLESQKSVERFVRQLLQSFHDGHISAVQVRLYLYAMQLVAPYACQDRTPYAREVETELTPAMRAICGEAPEPEAEQPSVEPMAAAEPSPATTAEPVPAAEPQPVAAMSAPVTPEEMRLLMAATDPVQVEHLRIEQLQRLTKVIRKLKGLPEDPAETS